MQHTADSESPSDFHFWTGVWTVAGALRRKVWINMRRYQWTPNFYIILVGPPGIAAKSTSISGGVSLLEKIEGVRFGPQSMTWQALAKDFEDAMEYIKYTDPEGQEASVAMSAINIAASELGTFLKLEDTGLAEVLIAMWEGQLAVFGHKTKASGNIEIRNPWLNLIGATTPSWMEGNFPKNMIGGGLTSRIIFVYGDRKRRLIPYPDELTPEKEYYEHEALLIEDLKQIALLSGQYQLSSEARVWGHDWYDRLWDGSNTTLASERYAGYISRKQTHLHKLGMVLAACESDKLIVEQSHLEMADQLLRDIEPHMIRVFESVGQVEEYQHMASITQFVRAYRRISGEELRYHTRTLMSEKDFKNAVRLCVEGKLIRVEQHEGAWVLVPVEKAPSIH